MIWFASILLLLPVTALGYVWITQRPPRERWKGLLTRVAVLFAVGLFAAGPFVTTHALGTSEAYNYSLAVADAVTQFRAGEFPALVGQSEYAFNGRIHPLRTAPYLTYFAGLLDLLTFRQLNFWALQNLALAVSLIAGIFSAYHFLRRTTAIDANGATILASAYLLGPGALAAAYSMDLYMSVMAVPYLPLVAAANMLALDGRRGFGTYVRLAAGLALCWWAHPPIALWCGLATLAVHLALAVCGRIRGREVKAILPAAGLGLLLAGYVFASALSVRSYDSMSAARAPEAIVKEVEQSFGASLRPVSPAVNELGDFQLGYALWAILAAAMVLALIRRSFAGAILCGAALLLLVFTVPVPFLTAWLWEHTPTFAMTANGPWPMQRVYLVASAWILFAFARVGPLPRFTALPKFASDAARVAIAVLAVWTVYQSWRFVERGYASRRDEAYTRSSHFSENINLTLIAYAMFTPPPSFVNGVMDPAMETRVLKRGSAEALLDNWGAQEAWGPVVQKGTFSATAAAEGDIAQLSPRLQLEPGKKYRLDFTFRTPPMDAVLRLIGPNTMRVYPLPQAGEPRGFGMLPSNGHALTLWTSAAETEIVTVELIGSGLGANAVLQFADFTLRTYDPENLPIRLDSLVPFRARVRSPEPGYLEIPRLFIKGYAAEVDGQPVRAQASPDGVVMAAVPAGESQVEIRYTGSALLRAAFWVSFWSWIALLGLGGIFLVAPRLREQSNRATQHLGAVLWRRKLWIAGSVALLTVAVVGWQKWRAYAEAAGPIKMRVVLPRGGSGRSQPLVTTGKPGEGAFIFVIYHDPTHIQVGVDVWGKGFAWISPPIEVDYFSEHEFVVSSSALYPPGHPKLADVDPAKLEALRNRVTVDLNGQRVLDQPIFAFDSVREAVTVGTNGIQGSSTEPKFVGEILEVERLTP